MYVLEIFQCHKIAVDILNRHLQNHNLKAHSVSVVNNNDDLTTIGVNVKTGPLRALTSGISPIFCTISIMKTCPCNAYPLEPHFYIAKLGYAGVYLFGEAVLTCTHNLCYEQK